MFENWRKCLGKLIVKFTVLLVVVLSVPSCTGEFSNSPKTTSSSTVQSHSKNDDIPLPNFNSHSQDRSHSNTKDSSHESKAKENLRETSLVTKDLKLHSHSQADDRAHQLEYFKVNDSGLSLSVISTMVYGTCKRWPEIARWNHLKDPYRIYVGQKLIVKDPVSLDQAQMDHRLLQLWRSRLAKREQGLVEKYWEAHSKEGVKLHSRLKRHSHFAKSLNSKHKAKPKKHPKSHKRSHPKSRTGSGLHVRNDVHGVSKKSSTHSSGPKVSGLLLENESLLRSVASDPKKAKEVRSPSRPFRLLNLPRLNEESTH